MTDHRFTLILLPGTFAIRRLPADAPIPDWAGPGGFLSITRTDEELSIICRQEFVPDQFPGERGWRCLRVAGTLDQAEVGVLASLANPLAAAGVSLFAVSTFDTDYLLVKEPNLAKALRALRKAGHRVTESSAADSPKVRTASTA